MEQTQAFIVGAVAPFVGPVNFDGAFQSQLNADLMPTLTSNLEIRPYYGTLKNNGLIEGIDGNVFDQAPASQYHNTGDDILKQAIEAEIPTLVQQPIPNISLDQSSALLRNDPPILEKESQVEVDFSEDEFIDTVLSVQNVPSAAPSIPYTATPPVTTSNALANFGVLNGKFPPEPSSQESIPDGQMEYLEKINKAESTKLSTESSSVEIHPPRSAASADSTKGKLTSAFKIPKRAKQNKIIDDDEDFETPSCSRPSSSSSSFDRPSHKVLQNHHGSQTNGSKRPSSSSASYSHSFSAWAPRNNHVSKKYVPTSSVKNHKSDFLRTAESFADAAMNKENFDHRHPPKSARNKVSETKTWLDTAPAKNIKKTSSVTNHKSDFLRTAESFADAAMNKENFDHRHPPKSARNKVSETKTWLDTAPAKNIKKVPFPFFFCRVGVCF